MEEKMIKVVLKDGSVKEVNEGLSFNDVVKSISISLAKEAIAVRYNEQLENLSDIIPGDGNLEVITSKDKEGLDILNHSTAHLLAHAVSRLYPGSMFGVGPTIDEGFYYDMAIKDANITISDLAKIEKEMHKIAEENISIVHSVVSKEEALKLFANDKYKQDIIKEIPGDEVNIYTQGDYKDVCRGPHVASTGKLKHFKLLNVAGAYWRGDSNNEMLTRVYGIAFFKDKDLQDYLKLVEERKERDHRKIGKDLDLFMISEYGPGFPFWLPKGMLLKNALTDFWMNIHTKAGYQFIQTPIMLNRELWEISGHWFNYKENMYTSTIDDKEFAIKPMNCPGGMLVYKNSIHSYRDLPLRLAELGLVHRHEASGALSGLFRVRSFTQDDAHIFMTEEQITDEIASIINLYKKVYDVFGLSFSIELSTRPEKKYIGDIAIWDKTEKALADACHKAGFEYKINPGDGAFYGPKLDFKLRDSMNRIWQCGTIQLDMNLPERFDLTYIAEDGTKKRPVMAHRALFGSLERFIGILTEHYAGAFPTWLAPYQVRIIPVSDKHIEYANKVKDFLMDHNIRVEVDYRTEKLGYKIREAQTKKVPYTLVLGDNEVKDNSVTYRKHKSDKQVTMALEEFLIYLDDEIKNLR